MKQIFAYLFICLTVLAPRSIWAQATVNENLETASIYVDAVKGSDSNPGTQSLPFKSISAATSVAQTNNYKGVGTKVIINPGTYRETVTLIGSSYYTSAPITFQANGSGVVVSGAVQYDNWHTYSGNSSVYSAPWANNWGLCVPLASGPLAADAVLRREMVFVNGVQLTQVMKAGQMRAGTFAVDEKNGKIYIWPAASVDINTADVEVATLPEVFHVVGVSNVVVRGMTFQYANSCRDNNAVYVGGSAKNILFDNDSFLWNNAIGLHIFNPVTNFTVQNSVANHNGQSGMMSVMAKNGVWKNVTTSFNNWRGAQGSYYNWNTGGFHFYNAHDQTISGLVTAYNQTHGVHWDTDAQNVTVTNMVATQNLAIGAVVEKSEGPVSITNSHMCGNNLGVKFSYLYQGGFVLRNSENVTLTNSTLYNNSTSQVNVIGQKGGIQVTNWETGQSYNLRSQNFTHTGNAVEAVGSQNTFEDSYLNGTDWTVFQTTLNSNKNNWWNGSGSTVFEVPVSEMHSLSGWRTVTAQDGLSTWSQPSDLSAACAVSSVPDYWLVVDNPSVTVAQDGTAAFNYSLFSFGGMTGTAAFAVDGTVEIPGVSLKVSDKSVPLTGTTTAAMQVAESTSPGTYPITAYATANGVTRTITTFLIVPVTSVRVSTLGLQFPTTKVRTASPVESFTITNFGKKLLTLSSLSFTGAKDYTETDNCGAVLTAGETCTVNVTFTPKAVGPRNGVLTINDGDANGPQVITLTGSGK